MYEEFAWYVLGYSLGFTAMALLYIEAVRWYTTSEVWRKRIRWIIFVIAIFVAIGEYDDEGYYSDSPAHHYSSARDASPAAGEAMAGACLAQERPAAEST